jgi:hypothetical protein
VSIAKLAGNRQFSRLGLGGPPEFGELLMESMAPILVKVERKRKGSNHVLLHQPGRWVRGPSHQSICLEPLRQPRLTRIERQSGSASNTAQFDPEFLGEKTAEREPQRRTFGIAPKVVANPMKKALLGRWPSVCRRMARRNTCVEKREVFVGMAPIRRNTRRNAPEVPGVDARFPRYWAGACQHFRASPEATRNQQCSGFLHANVGVDRHAAALRRRACR